MPDLADQIEKLARLKAEGVLTETEFQRAKEQLLSGGPERPRFSTVMTQFARARQDRWLGGVARGLANATELPVWAWRLAFVLLSLLHGVGVVLYILMWIFVPLEATPAQSQVPAPDTPDAAGN
jgi:phage shock protein C